MTFFTRPSARSFGKQLSFLSLLALAACDASFLHDVETRREATDRGCPAPNDGAHDIALVLEANGSISVTWTTKATNADSFVVERQSSREPTWGEIGSVSQPSFNDNRVVLDEEYGYRISAVRAAGGSTCATPASEPVALRTIPRAPGGFDAAGTGVGQITVSWDDVNTFEDGYRVTRTDAGGAKVVLPDLAANATAFVDSGVSPGSTYAYSLVAFNVSGESAAANDSQRAVTPPTLAWSTPPVIGPQCTLEAFGSATYDAGASFASAKGIIDGTDVPGSATGFSGQIAPTSNGPLETSWVVDDSEGGQGTLERTLTITQTPTVRSAPHRKLPGEEQLVGEGLQALQPTCADCGTAPLTSVAVSSGSTCAVQANGRVTCWGANGANQLGHGDVGSSYTALRPCADGSRSCGGAALRVETLDVGYSSTCGITTDGHGVCWGYGYQLILGRGIEDDSNAPVTICAVGDASGCTTPLANITQISMGSNTACAIAGGEVWCWGRDLFSAGNFHMAEPVCASGTLPGCAHFTAQQIDVGETGACAINAAGEVVCWGQNHGALFGTDPATESATPIPVCLAGSGGTCTKLDGADRVSVGADFACARRSNSLWCWGDNYYGQTGRGLTETTESVPASVCLDASCVGNLANVQSFDLGDDHACALVSGGEVYCWGYNYGGAAGPSPTSDLSVATPLCSSGTAPGCPHLTGIAGVATGTRNSCLWFNDGRAYCMGSTSLSGNAEYAPETGALWPVCRDGAGADCSVLGGVTHISAGNSVVCSIADGAVSCWGSNDSGQLALPRGESVEDAAEVQIGAGMDAAPLTEVRMVQTGDQQACALKNDGSVWCWGNDFTGVMGVSETGYGGYLGFARPVCLSGTGATCVPFSNVVSLSTGYQHACAVTSDGAVYCWGSQYCGEFGRNQGGSCGGPETVDPRPRRVLASSGSDPLGNIVEVGCGFKLTCVLDSSGGVQCFGTNESGQLGHGFADPSFPLPVAVVDRTSGDPVAVTNRVALRVGPNNGCAIGADGGVYCWGLDECGELGNPQLGNCTGTFRTDARPVCATTGSCTPLTGVIDIAIGINYMCALKADGTVACWGSNIVAELGRGFDNDGIAETIGETMACDVVCNAACSTPLTGMVSIAAAYSHTCGVRDDGSIYCWGYNQTRQTGSARPSDVEICSAQRSCASGDGAGCTANDVGDARVCNALSVAAP